MNEITAKELAEQIKKLKVTDKQREFIKATLELCHKEKQTDMTETEALILTNQTIIMNAIAFIAGPKLRKMLMGAADITLKEVDKYKI